MTVTYTNTRMDIIKCMLIYNTSKKAIWLLNILAATYISCVMVSRASIEHGSHLGAIPIYAIKWIIIFLICMCVMWIVQWLFLIFYVLMHHTKRTDRTVLTEHKITITEEGLIEETKFNKTLQYWHGVLGLRKSFGFIRIYMSAAGAHLVPKRAFASQSEYETFYAKLLEYTEKSKSA